jgi:hypothetical protein
VESHFCAKSAQKWGTRQDRTQKTEGMRIVESHFCAKDAQKWGTLHCQNPTEEKTVESHFCAKDSQKWGTLRLLRRSASLEAPLLL